MGLGRGLGTGKFTEPYLLLFGHFPFSFLRNERNLFMFIINYLWYLIVIHFSRGAYEHPSGVSESSLKKYIVDLGSENASELYTELTRKKRGHSSVFQKIDNVMTVKRSAREYISTLES